MRSEGGEEHMWKWEMRYLCCFFCFVCFALFWPVFDIQMKLWMVIHFLYLWAAFLSPCVLFFMNYVFAI